MQTAVKESSHSYHRIYRKEGKQTGNTIAHKNKALLSL